MTVTRFAPSPTGYLHVGGARTAIFNWLLARQTGGKFILRIEDTDQKRNTPTAAKQVMEDLRWLGLEWDEGPDIGGSNGPYNQSQRKDIYDSYIDKLIGDGKAYYCFESGEELAMKRKEAEKSGKGFVYRGPDKYPDESDVARAVEQGRDVTVRFAVNDDVEIVVNDIVRGEVRFSGSEISDFIIRKSDGFPTYHFACVVDDELMGVTHVCRGQEHLMNTPGHQLLQDALGFRRPEYAHMSVTVSEGGGKLSKRERPKVLRNTLKGGSGFDVDELARSAGITADEMDDFLAGKFVPDMPIVDVIADSAGVHLPEINVVDFFRSGYLPDTMVNFLALLGWNPGDDREVMTRVELIESFDIKRLSKSNSFFDRKKLLSFNTEHIKMSGMSELVGHFRAYLDFVKSPVCSGDESVLERILSASMGSRTLCDIEQKSRFAFLADDQIEFDAKSVKKVLKKSGALDILAEVGEGLKNLDELTAESIEGLLRGLAEVKGVGLGKVAQPLRVAICGNTVSLPIFDAVDMLGLDSTVRRIERAIDKFREDN